MNSLDFQFEKFKIPVTVGLPIHCFYFVIEPFRMTSTDRIRKPGEGRKKTVDEDPALKEDLTLWLVNTALH